VKILKHINYKKAGLALLSSLLIALAFPDYNLYPLLWISFIPLFFAIKNSTDKEAYWLAVLMGFTGTCLSFSWMNHVTKVFMEVPVPFNYLIWLAYAFYQAQLFGIIFLIFSYMKRRTNIPEIILFPVITVSIWSFFPILFSFNLGNGTTPFTSALQGMDITGVFGLDFIIALTNIVIYSFFSRKRNTMNKLVLTVGSLVILLWFGYGVLQENIWKEKIAAWDKKKIGIVQSNRPSSLYILPPEKGYSKTFPVEMDLSLKIANQKPDIIIWAEGNFFGYFEEMSIRIAFMKSIQEMGIPLLFHDYPFDYSETRRLYRNSSVLIKSDGTYGGRYDKRFIVPIGEYIPFIDYDRPFIQGLGLPEPITAGLSPVVFNTGGMLIQPLICYEIQFSDFVAESLGPDPSGKIIVLQSNDGWYGPGAEAAQHNSSTYLRAVEHRIPAVHVINNGRSSIVMPDGSNIFLSEFWKRGSWAVDMPYSKKSGGSFFSKHPSLFPNFIRILFFVMLFYTLFTTMRVRKKVSVYPDKN